MVALRLLPSKSVASTRFIPGRKYQVTYRSPGEVEKRFIAVLLEIRDGDLSTGQLLVWDFRPEGGTSSLSMFYVVDAEMVPLTVPVELPHE